MARSEQLSISEKAASPPKPRFCKRSARRVAVRVAALVILLAVAQVPAGAQAKGLALLVGVGAFQDPAFEPLRYAASDARNMAAYLADPKGGGFDLQDITVLINEQATKAAILRQIRRLVLGSQPQDTVLVYFSSHGAYTEKRKASIVCHDSRSTGETGLYGPVARSESVLNRENLHRFLRFLPARKRAVVVDVCNAAETASGLSCQPPKLDGYPPDSDEETGPDPYAGPGTGEDQITLVMTSCLGRERSWESRQLGASIFTYYLLQGLRAYNGDLVEAFYYSQERTQRQSSQEKGWCQMPYMIKQPPWQRLILAPPGKG
jgi:hypothetical protein